MKTGRHETVPDTPHAQFLFLPSNTTSCLQPLGDGVIGSLKKRYKRRQVQRALSLAHMNEVDMYMVEQLTRMR